MEKLTLEQRSDIARKAAQGRWAKARAEAAAPKKARKKRTAKGQKWGLRVRTA